MQTEPKLTVQLLEIESCKDYVKMPLQTLGSIYINQPKRFLPLAKEAKKLVEEFQKEQIASQWAGLPLTNYFRSHLWNNSKLSKVEIN